MLLFNSKDHPPYLTKGIRDADAILASFGHAAASDSHFDASKFGKYVEFQYSHDGLLAGWKVIDYNLQSFIVHTNATELQGQNFHIFYHLLAGATPKEKAEWYDCL
jgi:chitin synthase